MVVLGSIGPMRAGSTMSAMQRVGQASSSVIRHSWMSFSMSVYPKAGATSVIFFRSCTTTVWTIIGGTRRIGGLRIQRVRGCADERCRVWARLRCDRGMLAHGALAFVESLMERPRVDRVRCFAVCGDSGCGGVAGATFGCPPRQCAAQFGRVCGGRGSAGSVFDGTYCDRATKIVRVRAGCGRARHEVDCEEVEAVQVVAMTGASCTSRMRATGPQP